MDHEKRLARGRRNARRYAEEHATDWTCERCGATFQRMELHHRRPRFCSKGCADAAKLGGSPQGTVADRFWAKVDRSAGPESCWPWLGSHHPDGYGRLHFDGRMRPATHVALFLTTGERLPDGRVARHTCDNPPCVNPLHLLPGTELDNRADAVERGRAALGERVGSARLDASKVRRIRELATIGIAHRAIATDVGCHQTTVTRVLSGAIWGHVT